MRVLYFHQHFSTPNGATAIRSYGMARKLIAKGHQVTMVCGSYSGGKTGIDDDFISGVRRANVDGIDVLELNLAYANNDGFLKRIKIFLTYALKCIKLVFTEQYDVIFATSTPLTVAIPGIMGRWLRRKPFIFEVRDLWPELPRAMGVINNRVLLSTLSLFETISYRSANRLIGLSPGIVDGIIKKGISDEKITLIPNGCDLNLTKKLDDPRKFDVIEGHDFIAIYAGTHGMANGLNAILDAAAVLKKRKNHKIKFLLVGQGKLKSDLEERAHLEHLDNVIFHKPIDKISLLNLMQRADLGLQILADIPAFYYGTSPNKFFDYIASALPVLNNYPGWVANMIEQNDCGFVVPPNSPELFADALEYAAKNPEILKKRASNAYKLAERSFDRSVLSDNFVNWVEGVS